MLECNIADKLNTIATCNSEAQKISEEVGVDVLKSANRKLQNEIEHLHEFLDKKGKETI